MIKTVVKPFMIWQHLEEEAWLNEMAQQGWNLKEVILFWYRFEQGQPGEYIYRLEIQDLERSKQERQEYEQLLLDSGVEKVDKVYLWTYYRRKASLGDFTIFSDIDSTITHFKRIQKFLLAFIAVIAFFNLLDFFDPITDIGMLIKVINLLLVPGILLWAYVKVGDSIKKLTQERSIHE